MKRLRVIKGCFDGAFTIVELIVAISIIGILATIIFVSYEGWESNIAVTEMKNDLTNVVTAAEDYRNFNNVYPESVPSNVKTSKSVTLSGGSDDGVSYCYEAHSTTISTSYYIDTKDAKNGAIEGTCAGFYAPDGPSVNVALVGSDVVATVQSVSCTGGSTAEYSIRSSINEEGWTNYSDFSTVMTTSTPANDGSKYDYQAQARCVGSITTPSVEGVAASYVDPISATPAAPTVTVVTGGTSTWSWTTPACSSGVLARYLYDLTIPTSSYDSGWVNTTDTSASFTTISVGEVYNVAVRSQCYTPFAASPLGAIGSASYEVPESGKAWTQVSTGALDTCAIAEGLAYCWGWNGSGQLGNNSTSMTSMPVAVTKSGVLSGKTVTAISADDKNTCVVANGLAYCWGLNDYGQLGNNSTTQSLVPVAVNTSGVLSGKTVTAISAGTYHTCAIANGAAYCWGSGGSGRLGNNSTTQSLVPVAVDTSGVLLGKTVTAISAGTYQTCAIANGAAYCWGTGSSGRLGNNASANSLVPVAVDTSGVLSGKTVTAISSGDGHGCAIASGLAYCWGTGSSGRLGNNASSDSLVPVAVDTSGVLSGKTVTAISAGYNYTCAVADGAAYCWGDSSYSQLGNNSVGQVGNEAVQSLVPVASGTVGALSGRTVSSISASKSPYAYRHTCAITQSGSTYCWGSNAYGQAGSKNSLKVVAVDTSGVLSGKSITSISQNGAYACAVASNSAYCWGNGNSGQLGDGSGSLAPTKTPVAVSTNGMYSYLSSDKIVTGISTGGGAHTCAVASGSAYCWGWNINGQLGNNSTTSAYFPVAVTSSGVLSGKTITAVSGGNLHTCAIADGKAYCWGYNGQGQLGNNSTTQSLVPVAVNTSGVLSGKTVTAISAGYNYTCAVADGAAYCWGSGGYGRLGNNSSANSSVPVAVYSSGAISGKTVTAIEAADIGTDIDNCTCAIADGKAYCWGANNYGQLGDNSTTGEYAPVAVDTSGVLSGKIITNISTGGGSTCALANGNAYCWGSNNYGELGNGTVIKSLVPTSVDASGVLSGKTFTDISIEESSVCAIASGLAYCWGWNGSGQLGNPINTFLYIPYLVPPIQ